MRNAPRKWSGVLVTLLLAAACGGGGNTPPQPPPPPPPPPPPGPPATVAKQGGDNQTGFVGTNVGTAPSIKVTDANNVALTGVSVTFAVAIGGGSITGGTTTTAAGGIATLGSWTLGQAPGANTVTATVTGNGITGNPATFAATANAGPAKTLSKVAGDNQVAVASTAVAIPPSVKVVDQFNNPMAGVTVTFAVASGGGNVTGATPATDATGVATVGSWTAGAAPGANTLTATIAAAGVTGNPATFTATVPFPSFNPLVNTNISGNQVYASVNIPAGVTVTVTGDLTITTPGAATIAGSLVGDCKAVSLTADGIMTVTGTVTNNCSDPNADGVPLKLAGKTGWDLTGATLTSSGDISVENNPASALPSLGALLRLPGPRANATSWRCRAVNTTINTIPNKGKDGANGTPTGGDGRDGRSKHLGCGFNFSGQTGGSLLVDGVTINGSSGGHGGNGTSSSTTTAKGGDGGTPGAITFQADDDIDIRNTVNINGGNGGRGGNGTATAPAGSPGANATAIGGKGGPLKPKNFSSPVIFAAGGAITQTGTLNITLGTGGAGGDATATGGRGNDGSPGARGGDATGTGGDGGNSVPLSINASGAVSLNGSVNPNGGTGGAGGTATATPGAGGNGVNAGDGGGRGGNANGRGGNGGIGQPSSGLVSLVAGTPRAFVTLNSPGGKAGDALFSGANGGFGLPNCPAGAGGSGGAGGDVLGGDGNRGTGTPPGALGTTTINNFGNGGNGANGNGPGSGGAAGANGASHGSGVTGVIPSTGSFQAGTPGAACPVPPAQVQLNLTSSTPPLVPGVVAPGTYVVQLQDAATQAVVGSINLIAQGPAGNTFYGNDAGGGGPRMGWGSLGAIVIDLSSAKVNGQPYTFTSWQECVINTSVDAANPVLIEELDQNDVVIATTKVTSLSGCSDVPVSKGGKKIRNSKTGKLSSADKKDLKGKGS